MGHASLEDKAYWCERGEQAELAFLDGVAQVYGLALAVNPEKQRDKYATDMVQLGTNVELDLKTVTTPFFKAGDYGYDPQHTVTLNHKDYIRYSHKYAPEWSDKQAVILFWVNWPEQERYGHHVPAINGLWSLQLADLDAMVRKGALRCHEYLNRKNGNVGSNARASWLIDLRQCFKHEPITEDKAHGFAS